MPLKEVIERNGLKGRDIAEALSIAPETLSRWVQGRKNPNAPNLVRLLGYFRQFEPGLQVDDLMTPSADADVVEPASTEPAPPEDKPATATEEV